MKRIFLFLLTNIAVMISLSIAASLVMYFIGAPIEQVFGAEYAYIIVWAFVYGIGASIISLLISKPMAKFATRARVVDGTENEQTRWLVSTVEDLAHRANIKTPEVAIYEGSANAFATGAFKNSALVAVSSDIMEQMTKEELRAVLGHEISHVANGDMVTLCLIQGVLNAFVLIFARVIAHIAATAGNGERRRSSAPIYFLVYFAAQIVLSVLASLIVFWFSRRREYAADAGSAKLLGSPSSMIAALRRLGNLQPGVLPDSLKAMGIAEGKRTSIWSTHPSLEDRINALTFGNSSRCGSFMTCLALCCAAVLPSVVMAEDATATNVNVKVVACVGDSITYGHGASKRLETSYPAQLQRLLGDGWKVVNFGHNARTALNDGKEWNGRGGHGYCKSPQYTKSREAKPDYVIFMLGTNDSKPVNWDGKEEDFRRDYAALVDSYMAIESKPKVIIGVSPFVKKNSFSIRESVVGGSIAPWQRKFAEERKLQAVDCYNVMKLNAEKGYLPDGVHPNDIGYRALAEAFAAALSSQL